MKTRAGYRHALWFLTLALVCRGGRAEAAVADQVFRNGVVFTSNPDHPRAEALAVRDGRIVFVGHDREVAAFVGAGTATVDLEGRFLMPGLIDGHMHPLDAGRSLLKPSLEYDSLTEPEFRARIQGFLDRDAAREPDAWLDVVNWFQENMRPAGLKLTRASLDGLRTKRPIVVFSTFGHTALANSRALQMAGLKAGTPDPVGGRIWRGAEGEPTGLLEDSAIDLVASLLPAPTAEQDVEAARRALAEMGRQGITGFLDAAAPPESPAAFAALRKAGQLTARAHFAPVITPKEASDPAAAVARVRALARQYDEGPVGRQPGVTLRNAKLFLDGVISVPACTGAILEAYRTNVGTAERPRWVPGGNRGAEVYFAPGPLAEILVALGRSGLDPHMHCDGDGAVRAGLDACAALRQALPGIDIRPAIAHAELVAPADFLRFRELGVVPVLSFQWARPTEDQVALMAHLGPRRARLLEPAGRFVSAGVRPAFGSDWPVDRLDEWFAFSIGLTRRVPADDTVNPNRRRLAGDPGLDRATVLRAATCVAARELHMDDVTGSLEAGKFADFIVLDRNPLRVPAEEVRQVRVLRTVVGGDVVYEAAGHGP